MAGKYASSALTRTDRWNTRVSSTYHFHEIIKDPAGNSALSPTNRSIEGTAVVTAPCGVCFTDSEARALLRLLANSIDGLLDSGSPNVSLIYASILETQRFLEFFYVRSVVCTC